MLIIMTMVFLLLLLPLFTAGIRFNINRIRQQRCDSLLVASLPAACLAVSQEQLSLGRLKYDTEKMEDLIMALLQKNMAQSGLDASLKRLTIKVSTVSRPESPGHWLSGAKPSQMPLVDATATWQFPDKSIYTRNDRIELVLD